ncbi:MAG TPA: methylated-DNA--[protein]-cysteine S-methyltransferase [Bacteroidales bacterium]|nr:methylated-DNA--[protein]-cysteine S-methyltransferase [Bacteroidales bacterium]HNR41643.1 methylated-DNA--[protein]-cysteine S-methyltransferase [Bacteroidales bacterium]HPM18653.1 methylated-DNA--[protein]-cysteine S-methyltransferase [Bacteroidales bacterium]HQG77701.1 methylated-DNA--[protein]-cysteine S-methyltransferase [Bacteroidales bacterium]
MIKIATIETPIGEMTVAAIKEGICMLEFTEARKPGADYAKLRQIFNMDADFGTNRHTRALKKQLKEYFSGKRKEFSVPLFYHGSDFQKSVWRILEKIPYGKTISYMQLAEMLNNPKAIRAAANATGSNPLAIIIPCHRVVGSDGELTGYRGGIERKSWLIDHERRFSGQPVDGILF